MAKGCCQKRMVTESLLHCPYVLDAPSQLKGPFRQLLAASLGFRLKAFELQHAFRSLKAKNVNDGGLHGVSMLVVHFARVTIANKNSQMRFMPIRCTIS